MPMKYYRYYFKYYGSQYWYLKQINLLLLSAASAIVRERLNYSKDDVIAIDDYLSVQPILVDAFAGSGIVSFNAPVVFAKIVMNDIDEDVYLLHRLMLNKETSKKLTKMLAEIEYSRENFNAAREVRNSGEFESLDEFEKARIIFTIMSMSFNANMKSFSTKEVSENYNFYLLKRLNQVSSIYRKIELLNKNAFELLSEYVDKDYAVIFADPPWLQALRKAKKVYRHEFSLEEHTRLVNLLKNARAKVIILNYDNNLYREVLNNFDIIYLDKEKRRCAFINFELNYLARQKLEWPNGQN